MEIIDDFKAMFPEFDSSLVEQHWLHVNGARRCLYGGNYDNERDKMIILYLIAHLLQLRIEQIATAEEGRGANADAGRQVTSRSVGSVSESYAQTPVNTTENSLLESTSYGRQYLMLISRNWGGAWV